MALLCGEIVGAALARNHEHVQIAGAVTLNHVVVGVIDADTIHNEVVGVDLGLGKGKLNLPDAVGALLHIGLYAPAAAELDDGGIVGIQTEGDAVSGELRRLDLGPYEVAQFLCTGNRHAQQHAGENGK